MSTPLTYTPAYLGLYVSLLLAVTCNAFLDIRYGIFGTEVAIWATAFAVTLFAGWKQRGHITTVGRRMQKWMLLLAIPVSVLVFLPVWGLPRGGVYMLAALQAAYNCGVTTRRQLYLGLLTAVVMVMFATSHYRADWTLLFYLVPFVIALVFTLVAEQINRRVEDLSAQSLGRPLVGGQSAAIIAAASVILALAGMLYAVTPQITWSQLSWGYGVPAAPGDGYPVESQSGSGQSGYGAPGSAGLTLGGMREAARRSGMPAWQSGMINGLADVIETTANLLVPVRNLLREVQEAVKEWLSKHKRQIAHALGALILFALMAALWHLLRKAKLVFWLRTRFDYLRFGVFAAHGPGSHGIVQLYSAIQRLFAWQDLPRGPSSNTREYLAQLRTARSDLHSELSEMTLLFENARYSGSPTQDLQLSRMHEIYVILFKNAYRGSENMKDKTRASSKYAC